MEANHHFPLPNDVTDDDNDDDDDNQEDDDNLDDDDDADDSYDDYGCGADYDYDERGEDGKGNDTALAETSLHAVSEYMIVFKLAEDDKAWLQEFLRPVG